MVDKISILYDNILDIKNDNIRINHRINNLELSILKKDQEIKELKEDNDKTYIEDEIRNLKKETNFIFGRISMLGLNLLQEDKEVKTLEKEIDSLRKEIRNDKLKDKILCALIDIINNENLENKISDIYDDLIYLKSEGYNIYSYPSSYSRSCKTTENSILQYRYYIKNNDKQDIKNKKIELTIYILKQIPDSIKDEIIAVFDNDIIEKIIDYYEKNELAINLSNISEKELFRINNWWKQ